MSNQPLAYVIEEFERRTFTPNILMRSEPAIFLEEASKNLEEEDDITRPM